MNETREKYAKHKGIPLEDVPSVITVKGKSELEIICGKTDFHYIGRAKLDTLLKFTRKNGTIEGKILSHNGGEENTYYGEIFSMNSSQNELRNNLPLDEEREIEISGENREEVAQKLREFIKLEKAKEFEKIQEQFPRPDYAIGMPLYVSQEKENSEDKYSICFDTCPKNKHGLHYRPVTQVLNKAAEYNKKVTLVKEGEEAEGILGITTLYVPQHQNVTVKIKGTDEKSWKAAMDIYSLFEKKFGED